jgi:hypothetical protein
MGNTVEILQLRVILAPSIVREARDREATGRWAL